MDPPGNNDEMIRSRLPRIATGCSSHNGLAAHRPKILSVRSPRRCLACMYP